MNNTGTVEIQTERLLLRKYTMEDIPQVYVNYGSDPLVNRYISFAPCQSMASTERFIQMHMQQYENNLSFYGWAIVLNDVVIGSIGLFNIDEDNEQCELGYSLGSQWWHKGYASEAAKAILNHAFEKIGMHRVYASHHVDNVASGKVLLGIGMNKEGILRDG